MKAVYWILQKYIRDALKKPVDVAIATPDSLLRFRREGLCHCNVMLHSHMLVFVLILSLAHSDIIFGSF